MSDSRMRAYFGIPQIIVLTLLFEDQRREKLVSFASGIRYGLRDAIHYEPKRYLD